MITIFKYEKKTQLNHRVFYKLLFSENSNYIVSNPQVISCLRMLLYPILFNYLWRAGTKCKCFQPNVPTVSVYVWKPPNNLLQPMQHQLHKGLSSSKLLKNAMRMVYTNSYICNGYRSVVQQTQVYRDNSIYTILVIYFVLLGIPRYIATTH